MFDFLSYVRDSGVEIRLLPPQEGVLICLEVRDPETGYCEKHEITDQEAGASSNIDRYTGQVLDQMVAMIGRKRAKLYASRHTSRQMQEREDFFRGK
ncbi:MAG: hypothetical protein E7238_00290 [Sarcina sp.]|nr:hypothetical protein [Sarcina sp.]